MLRVLRFALLSLCLLPLWAAAAEVMQGSAPQTMLSPSIHDNFAKGVSALAGHAAVETIARGQSETGANQAVGALFQTDAAQFLAAAARRQLSL